MSAPSPLSKLTDKETRLLAAAMINNPNKSQIDWEAVAQFSGNTNGKSAREMFRVLNKKMEKIYGSSTADSVTGGVNKTGAKKQSAAPKKATSDIKRDKKRKHEKKPGKKQNVSVKTECDEEENLPIKEEELDVKDATPSSMVADTGEEVTHENEGVFESADEEIV